MTQSKAIEVINDHIKYFRENKNDLSYVPIDLDLAVTDTPNPKSNPMQEGNKINTPLMFLSGGAGTGKSWIIRKLSKKYKNSIVVLSSTMLSAINIEGQTLHSFFKLGINKDVEALKMSDQYFTEKTKAPIYALTHSIKKVLTECELLVIDEISMVSKETLQMIFYRIKQTKVQCPPILFTGDLFQLPPVKGVSIIHHPVFQNNIIPLFLTENMRTGGDKKFANLLRRWRVGMYRDEDESYFESRIIEPQENTIRLMSTNSQIDAYNNQKLTENPNTLVTLSPKVSKVINNKKVDGMVKQFVNTISNPLYLKVSSLVVFTRNASPTEDYQYYNGERAIVRKILSNSVELSPLSNLEYTITLNIATEYIEEFVVDTNKGGISKNILAQIDYYPLKLGYATSIHKAQGMSLDSIYLSEPNFFANGQAYVALSRLTNHKGLFLSDQDVKDAIILNLKRGNDEIYRWYLETLNTLDERKQI